MKSTCASNLARCAAQQAALIDGAVSERLVLASQRGDRGAFARLYEMYAPLVNAVLLARVPAPDVEDLKQEVFVAALESISTVRDPAEIAAWLASIARRLAANLHRSRRPTEPLPAEVLDRRANASVSDGRMLLERIREMPEAYREPLLLRFVEGMTGPEIASVLGLTHGSVRVNLSRGVAMLRERLSGVRNA